MWINDGKVEKQVQEESEIPCGFIVGRLKKHKKSDDLTKKVNREDVIKYYIVENHSFIECLNHFGLENRYEFRIILNEYKINKGKKKSHPKQTRSHESYVNGGKKSAVTQMCMWKNMSAEKKEEWREKQRVAHSSKSFREKISKVNIEYNKNLDPKIKEERNKARSISCKKAYKDGSLYARQKETKKQKRKLLPKGFCKTQEEQKIYDCLICSYPDIVYDVKVDDRYPYYVDFYIPSKDLFIEYQGFPAHGNYPYIEGDEKSLNESVRLYGEWRKIYLEKDVEKFKKAQSSKISLLRIYPNSTIEENLSFNDSRYAEIIKTVYFSAK